MKENFLNLAKEIDFQDVQEGSSESQRSWTQGITHQSTSELSYPRLMGNLILPILGDNFKISKRKGDSYLQRSSHKTLS